MIITLIVEPIINTFYHNMMKIYISCAITINPRVGFQTKVEFENPGHELSVCGGLMSGVRRAGC